MKTRFIAMAVACIALAIGLGTAAQVDRAAGQGKKGFGTSSDIAYGNDLWKALQQAGLVGVDAVLSHFYSGVDPHGFVLETLDTRITVRGHKGAVVVKRNYGPKGVSVKQVIADPQKHLEWITVMFKRKAGYDTANKDWFWAKFTPTGGYDKHIVTKAALVGRVGSRKSGGGCIGCHTGADPDMVFVHDRIK